MPVQETATKFIMSHLCAWAHIIHFWCKTQQRFKMSNLCLKPYRSNYDYFINWFFQINIKPKSLKAPPRNFRFVLIVATPVDKRGTAHCCKDPIARAFVSEEWKNYATYLHSASSGINTNHWKYLKKNILASQKERWSCSETTNFFRSMCR